MTLYDDLGIDSEADAETVRRAFYARAKATHPDVNPDDPGAADKFRKALIAYETLGDQARRKRYDETGQNEEAPEPSTEQRARSAIRAAFAAALTDAFADSDRVFRDLTKDVAARLRAQKSEFTAKRREAARLLAREKRLRGRVKGAEFISELDDMIRLSQAQILVCEQNEQIATAALALLSDGYAHDPDQPPVFIEWGQLR